MHIYTAAVCTNRCMGGMREFEAMTDREKAGVDALPNILESWHYVGKQQYVDAMRANNKKIFLDSGAFSAYTLGVTLKVEDYVDYIQRNRDILRVEDGALMASVLDGIGDADQTWRNQMHMEHLGVRPLPCFHFGEPIEALHWYVKNYEYITLGGMVGATTNQLRKWLEGVWEEALLDGSGRAKIKVHGFGITSRPLMEEFDWYSCDSSSWVQSASFGSIETPRWGPIAISDKSPSRHTANQHLRTLPPEQAQVIIDDITANGFDPERLSVEYRARFAYNLWAYGQINELMNVNRRTNYLQGKAQDLFRAMQC